MVLHLQNFDIIRIIFPQAEQSQHHAGEDSLYSVFFVAGSGEGQSDACVLFLDPNLGICATYIIDGGFSHGNNSGNCCADDIAASFAIAAVAVDGETGDPVIFHKKFASSHNYSAILVISTLV